jgi:hypothetical protein
MSRQSSAARRSRLTLALGSQVREYLFNIAESFQIAARGLVLASDLKIVQIPQILMPGQVLEFCPPQGCVFQARVTSIEHHSPFSPYRPLGFTVEASVQKEHVPVGTAVWLVSDGQA